MLGKSSFTSYSLGPQFIIIIIRQQVEALSSYVRCEEMLKERKPGPIVDMTGQDPVHMIEKSAKSFKYFPLWCGLRNTSLSEIPAPLHSWINFLIVHD